MSNTIGCESGLSIIDRTLVKHSLHSIEGDFDSATPSSSLQSKKHGKKQHLNNNSHLEDKVVCS
jgi:hypothetical protein